MAPQRCSRVDFPQPEGPTIATNSPAATVRLTSVSAATSESPAANVFPSCSATSSDIREVYAQAKAWA